MNECYFCTYWRSVVVRLNCTFPAKNDRGKASGIKILGTNHFYIFPLNMIWVYSSYFEHKIIQYFKLIMN